MARFAFGIGVSVALVVFACSGGGNGDGSTSAPPVLDAGPDAQLGGSCPGITGNSRCVDQETCIEGWYKWSLRPGQQLYCRCDPREETCSGTDDDCNGIVDDPAIADEWCSLRAPGAKCENRQCRPCPQRCNDKCTDTSEDVLNCGGCGNACAVATPTSQPTCSDTGCKSISILANGTFGQIAIDETSIYFVEESRIKKCARPACTNPTLVTTQAVGNVSTLAVSDGYVYWTAESKLGRCPVTGCATNETVSTSSAGNHDGIAFAGDRIVFAQRGNTQTRGRIASCPKTGCLNAPTFLAEDLNQPTGPIVDGELVYWFKKNEGGFTTPDNGQIFRCPLTGCGTRPTLVVNGERIEELVITANRLWFLTGGYTVSGTDDDRVVPNALKHCPLDGCVVAPSTLAESPPGGVFSRLRGSGDNLFWIAEHGLRTCPAAGCPNTKPAVLASFEKGAPQLVVDTQTFFMADQTKILSLPR